MSELFWEIHRADNKMNQGPKTDRTWYQAMDGSLWSGQSVPYLLTTIDRGRTKRPPSYVLSFWLVRTFYNCILIGRTELNIVHFMVSLISSKKLDIFRREEQIKSLWHTLKTESLLMKYVDTHASPSRFSVTRITYLWTDPALMSPLEVQQASNVCSHSNQ